MTIWTVLSVAVAAFFLLFTRRSLVGKYPPLAGLGSMGPGPSMKHYYPDVPGIGNVAVSRHAQDRLAEDGISEREFEAVLLRGDSVPEGQDILWRQKDGIRLVILLKPEPFRGATLVKTAYRIELQAKATS